MRGREVAAHTKHVTMIAVPTGWVCAVANIAQRNFDDSRNVRSARSRRVCKLADQCRPMLVFAASTGASGAIDPSDTVVVAAISE